MFLFEKKNTVRVKFVLSVLKSPKLNCFMLKEKTSVKYYQGTPIQTLSAALCVTVSVLISDNPPYSGSLFQSNICNFFP